VAAHAGGVTARACVLATLASTIACGSVPRAVAEQTGWVGTWAASPQPAPEGDHTSYADQTLRLVVHTTVGGTRVRVRIANLFDDHDVVIGAAHVARRAVEATIDPRSDRTLRFGGSTSVTLRARSSAWSDPVDLDVRAGADLAISLFLPNPTRVTTTHVLALQTSYVSLGDTTAATAPPVAGTIADWPFVTGVDVAAAPRSFAVVAFGDSIVDGDGSTADANRRWPDRLASRLGGKVGVLDEGIIGNRLLRDSPLDTRNPLGAAFGPSALARFDRDVLAQSSVRVVIVRAGTNDIAFPGVFAGEAEAVDRDAIAGGFRQLVARARARGVRVIGATLTPFEGATLAPGYYSAEKEQLRQDVNEWIRRSSELDAVIDFDRVLRDPTQPRRLLPAYDSGDHLHPNDAGYAAMADAVPLDLLTR
jgi:lysophospholipase L1-like esterase